MMCRMWYCFFLKFIVEVSFIFGDAIDQSLVRNFAGSKTQTWQGSRKLIHYAGIHGVSIYSEICVGLEDRPAVYRK